MHSVMNRRQYMYTGVNYYEVSVPIALSDLRGSPVLIIKSTSSPTPLPVPRPSVGVVVGVGLECEDFRPRTLVHCVRR